MQTLDAFDKQFTTEEACKAFLVEARWPNGVTCPRCQRLEKIYRLKSKSFHWVCKNIDCGGKSGYRFSILTRTIFQDTKTPLKLWFKVGYLMLTAKKGVSALQLHRVIFGEDSGSDYRTTWYMCHRWRSAMKGDVSPLSGEVEVDETYVGGKDKNRHRSKRFGVSGGWGKVAVIGAIARKGMVVAQAIERTDAATLQRFVRETVAEDVSLVATDDYSGYRGLKRQGIPHESVSHFKGEYVRGRVHTANLDSFWSLFKRGIMGSFHHVSKDYLPLYINEFSYRHNMRKNPNAFMELLTTSGK
ncbi:MAG: IS1595 family transposase [Nitrospiraceae bacterium]